MNTAVAGGNARNPATYWPLERSNPTLIRGKLWLFRSSQKIKSATAE
jgi:hypothetical protein